MVQQPDFSLACRASMSSTSQGEPREAADQSFCARFVVRGLDDQQRSDVEQQRGGFQGHWLQAQKVGVEGAGGSEILDEQADGRELHDTFCDSMPKKIMLPSRSATSKSRRP